MQPPEIPNAKYTWPVGLIVVGGLAITQGGGAIALGALLIAAGIVMAAAIRNQVEAAEAALAEWKKSHWCIGCSNIREPDWRPPTEAA
ncbi:hypothetical protein DEH69_22560 [Streptomyces sp. PT12]|nr:hypothetical protein DEH69_22560 [Streptomyces sp. PT12]